MWISKDEYNELVTSAKWAETWAKRYSEVARDLSVAQLDLLLAKVERDRYKKESEGLADVIVEKNREIVELQRHLDKADKYTASLEKELESTKRAYESEHQEASEWFWQYGISEENKKRWKEKYDTLATEASKTAIDLHHAELDLALYKKAFDDIAHAFGDKFRHLSAKEVTFDDGHQAKARYATWVLVGLWSDVHDIMKNAGWRVKDEQDSKN